MKYRLLFLLLHAAAAWLSLKMAFHLRFYFNPLTSRYDEILLQSLPVAIVLKTLLADGFGLTRRIWHYASFRDVKPVVLAAIGGSALFGPVVWWMTKGDFPNGPLMLDCMLTLTLFMAIRFSGRFWVEARQMFQRAGRPEGLRILILGAGDRGEMALRFLESRGRIIGFLDDQPDIQQRLMMGVPVLGHLNHLQTVLEKQRVDDVVIALQDPGPERIREIFEAGSALGCQVSLMPEISGDWRGHDSPIRELKMSDFLGREPVELDPAPLEEALRGKTVLVTGAGGSIGSELCRQIARLPVEKLLLLDCSETMLFEISEELKTLSSPPQMEVLLCDIRFAPDMQVVFEKWRPDLVYHAAACKHVPMMESHPLEAARTNVLGTRNLVKAAREFGVERFLHVSTDKVVEASGIMGASKAWGERIVRGADFNCVRFGNVLGSSGSVIPLFEKQWQREGQLQVTHREATRYFMTIEEAVLLMLHAEILRGRGEVYILDMGEPIRILDLARQMVRMRAPNARGMRIADDGGVMAEPRSAGSLSGRSGAKTDPALAEKVGETGNANVESRKAGTSVTPFLQHSTSNIQHRKEDPHSPSFIRIVGLRPGERIHERLHTPSEKLEPTPVPKVNKLSGRLEMSGLEEGLEKLEQAVDARDIDRIRELLLGMSDGEMNDGG